MAETEVYNQSLTIDKLFLELEEERKASTWAVEEALSMIMRLQVEKAAEKMEASQYKRMTEEKLRHAENSISCLQETIHQKNMEIEFLKYKLLAYEHGVSSEFRMIEMLSTSFIKRTITCSARRNISMPAIQFEKLCSEMGICNEYDSSFDRENFEKVKSFKGSVLEEKHSDSDQVEAVNVEAKEQMHSTKFGKVERFEAMQVDNVLDSVSPSCCSCCEIVDNVPLFDSREIFAENRIKDIEGGTKIIPDNINQEIERSNQFRKEIELIKGRIKRLENDKRIIEDEDSERSKEQLKLLHQILEHLNRLQVKVNDLNAKENRHQQDTIFVSLTEEMLHFWI